MSLRSPSRRRALAGRNRLSDKRLRNGRLAGFESAVVFALCLACLTALAPTVALSSKTLEVRAVRVQYESILVDGALSEQAWQRPGITGFTQLEPDEGAAACFRTEVWLAYDGKALYVAARLHDPSPDSIVTSLNRRDETSDSDLFQVDLDTFHDHQTGFSFAVNPSGCMRDETLFNDSWRDASWDAAWKSGATVDEEGWSVEMGIPLSQLRFQKSQNHVWGVNFSRLVKRCNEVSSLVFYPRTESKYVSLFVHLVGLEGIGPARRVEILPYSVGRGEFSEAEAGNPFNDGSEYLATAGLDFKLGIGSNLTVDGTVNPDFGQVEVDPAVVNLSEFETFYQEKRPFFVEGADNFMFGLGGATNYWGIDWFDPMFFYSRRIGRAPRGEERHDGFLSRPDAATILGAAKLSGKLPGGWSLGVLQAVTDREYVQVHVDTSGLRYREEIEPLTSYTVVRGQKRLNGGRQSIGLIGTSVLRDIQDPLFAEEVSERAFTAGMDGWTFLDEEREWVVTGWSGATHVQGTEEAMVALQEDSRHYYQRPDASHVQFDPDATSMTGWGSRLCLNKEKGNSIVNVALGALSPGFETNDAGFHMVGDKVTGHVVTGYRWFEPDRIFRTKTFAVATARSFDFGGRRTSEEYLGLFECQFSNYWSLHFIGGLFPESSDNHLTRGGPVAKSPFGRWFEVEVDSDSRKKIEIGIWGEVYRNDGGAKSHELEGRITFKPLGHVRMSLHPSYEWVNQSAQWVDYWEEPYAAHTYGSRYIFATMEQKTVSLGMRVNCTFSPRTSFQLYAQPLISVGDYREFKEFAKPDAFEFNTYGESGSTITPEHGGYTVDPDGAGPAGSYWFEDPDFNYKSLRVNAVFRWEYRPGSALYLVWTQFRENEEDPGKFDFSRDWKNLFDTRPENIFLVKVTYWLSL
ncbi:MAG: carbohydrate binding family 9 domain-containing protein [Candidatus Eiseniibacteriota bacterium]|nr:MAG: carbohydrate binding family 9 domain-containing protein [Candidatus Eisenbacteria bacterium]